jgi:hypothetical protein
VSNHRTLDELRQHEADAVHVFPDFQAAIAPYCALGIPTIPVAGANGKQARVRGWETMSVARARKLATKPEFEFANVGILCGKASGITVVDLDEVNHPDAVAWCFETFGPSPVVVRTGSGKHHVYYRYSGERRRPNAVPGHKIDILGDGGYCVAPPSIRPLQGRYEFMEGGLSDLEDLPPLRAGALDAVSQGSQSALLPEGQRNTIMFKVARELARPAATFEELIARLRDENARRCVPPLEDRELVTVARSAWGYKAQGRLWLTGDKPVICIEIAEVEQMLREGDADCFMAYCALRHFHWNRDQFAFSPKAMSKAGVFGSWSARRLRKTRERLRYTFDKIECVHRGGRHARDPSLYKLKSRTGGRSEPQCNGHGYAALGLTFDAQGSAE